MGSDNLKSGLGIQNLFLALWITKASFSLWLYLFSSEGLHCAAYEIDGLENTACFFSWSSLADSPSW